MTTRDYQRAADSLRCLRVDMLVLHALRPPAKGSILERVRTITNASVALFLLRRLGVPYVEVYELLNRNRHLILDQPRPQ